VIAVLLFTKQYIMKVRFLLMSLAMLSSTILMAGNVTATTAVHSSVTKTKVTGMTKEQKEAKLTAIKARMMEIKNMDKSQMSKDEKKALRKEYRELNREGRDIGRSDLAIVILGGALVAALLVLVV
jgi:predicted Mrr-cat superfamily restriction endonuclease